MQMSSIQQKVKRLVLATFERIFPPKNVEKFFRIIHGAQYIFDFDNPVLIVVDWEHYDIFRDKVICGKQVEVGIGHSTDLLKSDFGQKFNRVLIITCDIDQLSEKYDREVFEYFDVVAIKDNVGQDIDAYKEGVAYIAKLSQMKTSHVDPIVVLTNSSCKLKSSIRFKKMIDVCRVSDAVCGVGCGFGPRTSLVKHFHLQSYFLISKLSFFSKIFERISCGFKEKLNIIQFGEIEISIRAQELGLPLIAHVEEEVHIYSKPHKRLFSGDIRKFLHIEDINII